ncbi:hypothetical protein SLS60_007543 [Paraconiothyrium brasiliense]|uniref:DUF2383 domain-containing protein n=1 Tax=Paraconiothyrium brasiliense TaxID=300254 RepID=A0ABR3R5N1_9PLEO
MAKYRRCRALRKSTGTRCREEAVWHKETRCQEHVGTVKDYKGKRGDTEHADEAGEADDGSEGEYDESDVGMERGHGHDGTLVEEGVLSLNRRAREILLDDVAGEEVRHVERARSLRRELATSAGTQERIRALERTVEALMDRAATQDHINDRMATGQLTLLSKYMQAEMGQERLARENEVLYRHLHWLWQETSRGPETVVQFQQEMKGAAHGDIAEKFGKLGREVYETWGEGGLLE